MAHCKICEGPAQLYDVVDLRKICDLTSAYPRGLRGTPVYYERCEACGFIFTRHFDDYGPSDWSRDIYNEEYGLLDPEYHGQRAQRNARLLHFLFRGQKRSVIGLDYGGGNGNAAQLLRLSGFDFDCHDPFGVSEMTSVKAGTYNLVTAFEVFEHVTDPLSTLSSILDCMTSGPATIIIGTLSSDGNIDDQSRLTWWYAAPRNGHVSLYSRRSLAVLAAKFGLTCVSPLAGTHIMSRSPVPRAAIARLALSKVITKAREAAARTIGRS